MWLYVYMPHLYLQSLPMANEQPMALIHPRHNHILDMNTAAKQSGIKHDMSLSTASLLNPQCQWISLHTETQKTFHENAALTAGKLASWVSLDEEDGLYLEIASMKKLMGDGKTIAQNLRIHLPHLTLFIASAPNAKAAKLLARSEIEQHLSDRTLLLFMKGLRCDRLSFPPSLELALKKLGIRTLGELFKFSAQDVAYRIDRELAKELQEITGERTFLPTPFKPSPRFYYDIPLQHEAEHQSQLRFPIKNILKHFSQFLQESNLTSQQLQVDCFDREHGFYSLPLRLARHTHMFEPWFDHALKKLERFHPTTPIIRLVSHTHELQPHKGETPSLLAESTSNINIDPLLNTLSTRLGADHLGFLSTHPHHLPEQQTLFTLAPERHTPLQPLALPVSVLVHPPKPVRLEHYHLLQGPHRIHSQWWEGEPVVRDYYVAQHQQEALHWIFTTHQQKWYLHGYLS